MSKLKIKLESVQNTPIALLVDKKLNDFSGFVNKPSIQWYGELCYCILAANARAKTSLAIQEQLGVDGFLHLPEKVLAKAIKDHKHRFHNNKAKYITESRLYTNIKHILDGMTSLQAREWLVKNIKGFGYKEASHFLRNTGKKNIAVLDRHILSIMQETGLIKEKPKTLNRTLYLEIEKKFIKAAEQLNLHPAELDLYMWSMKTGTVIK